MESEDERRLEIVHKLTKETYSSGATELQQKAMKITITILCCFFVSILIMPSSSNRILRVKHTTESGASHQYPLLLHRVTDFTQTMMPEHCRKNLPQYCPTSHSPNSRNFTNTLLDRSISPWYWVRIHNQSYSPHNLVQACCACLYCVNPNTGQHYDDLYSEEITVPVKVTDCATGRKIIIDIAVGCTCVRHQRRNSN